jgi:solute carrier family 41
MIQIDQLIMIIPVILNLKGNLEMNLSARLGTSANVGDLDIPEKRNALILGNLALLQVQAALVSFVAAGVSELLGMVVPRSQDLAARALWSRRPRPALPPKSPGRKITLPVYVAHLTHCLWVPDV